MHLYPNGYLSQGIEYGDMQLIAEVYDILRQAGGMENQQLAAVFSDWNKNELQSYLIEITAVILGKEDELTGCVTACLSDLRIDLLIQSNHPGTSLTISLISLLYLPSLSPSRSLD